MNRHTWQLGLGGDVGSQISQIAGTNMNMHPSYYIKALKSGPREEGARRHVKKPCRWLFRVLGNFGNKCAIV